jgi:hypothetical protein
MVRVAEMTTCRVHTSCRVTGWFRRFVVCGSSIFRDAGLDFGGNRTDCLTSNTQLDRHKPSTLSVDLIGDNYCRSIHTKDQLSQTNHLNIHRDLIQSPWRRRQNVPPKHQFQPVTLYGAVTQKKTTCLLFLVVIIKQPPTGTRLLFEFTGMWTNYGNHGASLIRHGTRLQRHVSHWLALPIQSTVHRNINCYAIK